MKNTTFIFRQCITLRNGKRICMPPGRAFKIPVDGHDDLNENGPEE